MKWLVDKSYFWPLLFRCWESPGRYGITNTDEFLFFCLEISCGHSDREDGEHAVEGTAPRTGEEPEISRAAMWPLLHCPSLKGLHLYLAG